ncbi:hypothetical protein [Burkholderia pseudomallei]|uniref:Uncharacterized protein n=2 Tax=Burkholderia pseudomallei TaxID=28450 RepID=Q3JUK1_BURP1|nr:hypothetical protein [Burkholderia pseudomallei]ABA48091.1 hypothetical protein BURPS1710b_1342 [Burkholderia pseudomallei 1710b]AFR15125.1 hypothetical protein BPC006_I1240 [Burkholderia pseudomallei BPC006]AYX05797.1 hypothetical protein EGY14_18055 [Burkholderia pseudomallei]EDO93990.1 hypothetical protein BURPSPAST_A0994 [Burkholderia pseudomallei Pasteur 52237]EET08082.1 hypothetical protein BURPS1710A_1507 [Burkholderia pseudomallei 1710a]
MSNDARPARPIGAGKDEDEGEGEDEDEDEVPGNAGAAPASSG